MIRASRTADVIRYGIFGGPAPGNRAYPLAAVGTQPSSAMSKREVMAVASSMRSRGTHSLTLSHGRYVPAIVAARPRSTHRCWELSHLLSDSPEGEACADVLGIMFRDISKLGGERIFLRLREDDPLKRLAASCGFTKYGEELLLTGPKSSFADAPTDGVRPIEPVDEHDLFRLYNASTPSRARFALGMTLEQWRAARGRGGWSSREYLHRKQDAAQGWVQVTRRGRTGIVTLMSHPGAADAIPALISHGMSRAWGVKDWYCLVRTHQGTFEALLRARGFQEAARYVTFTRAITSPVTIAQPGRAERLAGLNPAVDLSERLQQFRQEPPVRLHS